MDDLRQSILYGCLPIEISFQTLKVSEQFEVIRYIVANPACIPRLRIQDRPDDRVALLLRYITPPPADLGRSDGS